MKFILLLLGLLATIASCTPNLTVPAERARSNAGARVLYTCGTTTPFTSTTFACYDNDALWSTDFEQTYIMPRLGNQAYVQDSVRTSLDIARSGTRSLKCTWGQNQYIQDSNASTHSEVYVKCPNQGTRQEKWIGFSVYLPAAQMRGDKLINFFQWHGYWPPTTTIPNNGCFEQPSVAFELRDDDKIYVHTRTTDYIPCRCPTPLPDSITKSYSFPLASFDQWVDLVIHIRFDDAADDAKTGILEVWQNGNKVVNASGVDIGYPDGDEYIKFGLYCWPANWKQTYTKPNKLVYFDCFKDANQTGSYTLVAPSSPTNPMKPQIN